MPTLAPAPHPPHQHLSSPQTQVQQAPYLKEETNHGLIDGWDDQQDTNTAEQALRAHLLQNIQAGNTAPKPVSQSPSDQAGSVTSHDDNLNIDPAISGVGVNHQQPPQGLPQLAQQHPPPHPQHQQATQNIQIQGTTPEMQPQASPEAEGSGDAPKRGGKRELSTSKRAAQNRAAQRAFRQRKEGYIKKLEEQVRDMTALEESYKAIQNENYQLRDYIISLQSRLIESQGEDAVPPAPILITHQQPQQQQQPLPFQPPPPGVVIPHAPSAQPQAVHTAPPAQAAPTAPMGVPVPVPAPLAPQMVPQATMLPVSQPAQVAQQQVQQQQQQAQQAQQVQQAQQAALENSAAAAAKRALEEGDGGAYAEYVTKKLRGEDAEPLAQASAADPAPTVETQDVNGSKS